jgi:hypothetical protein
VQRLATIAHGDGICTTHVTAPSLTRPGTGQQPDSTADINEVGGKSA